MLKNWTKRYNWRSVKLYESYILTSGLLPEVVLLAGGVGGGAGEGRPLVPR